MFAAAIGLVRVATLAAADRLRFGGPGRAHPRHRAEAEPRPYAQADDLGVPRFSRLVRGRANAFEHVLKHIHRVLLSIHRRHKRCRCTLDAGGELKWCCRGAVAVRNSTDRSDGSVICTAARRRLWGNAEGLAGCTRGFPPAAPLLPQRAGAPGPRVVAANRSWSERTRW